MTEKREYPPLKHVYDPKMRVGANIAIWHADRRMEALACDLFETVRPKNFVETGTNMGWTSHWVATHYPDVTVHTVELSEEYFRLSGENLVGLPNVRRTRADSRAWLKALLPLEGTTLFWLDAHFNPDNPLREECRLVAKLDTYVCLIDDFHCGPDFPGDPASVVSVEVEMGRDYWRPNYAYKTGYSGYILLVKGVDYEPPRMMRRNLVEP